MSKKTYRTFTLKGLCIRTQDAAGRSIEAIFRGGVQLGATAKFTTSDKKVQEALEKSRGFNRDFYLESTVEKDVKPEAPADEPAKAPAKQAPVETPPADIVDSRRFRNLIEMKDALREKGVEVKDEWNYPAAKAAALKVGLDYQIQKSK